MCGSKSAGDEPLNARRKRFCQPDPEIRQIFAELAEQWRALAEQTEFLERFH
jgi:hypothetical protein